MTTDLYFVAAQKWLRAHNSDGRRECLVLALLYTALSIVAVVVGLGMLTLLTNLAFGLIGLAIFIVAFYLMGGFRQSDSHITGATVAGRPTRGGMNMTLFEFLSNWLRLALNVLAFPLRLPGEIRQAWRKQRRLQKMDEPEVARVLALMLETQGSMPIPALATRLAIDDPVRVLDQLADVEGVIVLDKHDKVTMTDETRLAIHAVGNEIEPVPE